METNSRLLKNKIKRNMNIDSVKKIAYLVLQCIVRKIERKKANYAIKNVCKHKVKEKKIKIGFIVQAPSLWDKQVKIYEEAKKRENIETFLFVVPETDWRNQCIVNNYKNNYFISNYLDAIRIYDEEGNIIDLEEYELNYLFYPRPYDIYLPKQIRSVRMCSVCKCCYVPYGFTASDAFNEGNVYNKFFDNMYFCFMDSNYMKKLLTNEYLKEIKKGLKNIVYLGYPSLETYILMGDSNCSDRITWTPRWSYDEVGGSNFLEYKDLFVNLIKNHNGTCIFRPHPLMFDELISMHMISEKEKKEYIEILEKNKIIVDDSSPIDTVLEKTDVLISDFSTIIGTFFLTGRPIIYCDKGIELNEIYADMAKYMYVAHSWDEVEKYYKLLVIDKNDFLKNERKEYISRTYGLEINASKNIINALIDDSN